MDRSDIVSGPHSYLLPIPFGETSAGNELDRRETDQRETDQRAAALMRYIRGDEFQNLVGDTIFRTRELYRSLQKEAKAHWKVWNARAEKHPTCNPCDPRQLPSLDHRVDRLTRRS